MKKSFRLSVVVAVLTCIMAIGEACNKNGDPCKKCEARTRLNNELLGSATVCTQEEENAFRSQFEGAQITCE